MRRRSYFAVVETVQIYQVEEEHQITLQRSGQCSPSNRSSTGEYEEWAYRKNNDGVMTLDRRLTQIKSNDGILTGGRGPLKIGGSDGTLMGGLRPIKIDSNYGCVIGGGGAIWIRDNHGSVCGGRGPLFIERNYGSVAGGSGGVLVAKNYGSATRGRGGFDFQRFQNIFGEEFGETVSTSEQMWQLGLTDWMSEDEGNDAYTDKRQKMWRWRDWWKKITNTLFG